MAIRFEDKGPDTPKRDAKPPKRASAAESEAAAAADAPAELPFAKPAKPEKKRKGR